MEMEYHDTSRRGRLLIILGVVLALAAGLPAIAIRGPRPRREPSPPPHSSRSPRSSA